MEGIKIKDLNGYRERMTKTLTRAEKLFFLDHIDMYTYSTIIDFGGADGALIHELQRYYPDLAKECHFIIVDNNPQMINAYDLKSCTRVFSLEEAKKYITCKQETLFICSSVLHECSSETLDTVTQFCEHYVRTLVMRDMAYVEPSERSYEDIPLSETEFESFKAYQIIKSNEDLYKKFLEMLPYCHTWEQGPTEALTHFILKYEYTANWDSELKENYFSNNIIQLFMRLRDNGWLSLYTKNYVLPYKGEQAAQVFKFYCMPVTHMQVVLERPSYKNDYKISGIDLATGTDMTAFGNVIK